MKHIAIIAGVFALLYSASAAAPAGPAGPDDRIVIPAGHSAQGLPLEQLIEQYAEIVGKTPIIAKNIPSDSVDFETRNDMTFIQAKAFYETLLSQRQVAIIPMGEIFFQVIPAAEVVKTPPKFTTMSKDELPDGQIYVIKTVQLQYAIPSELTETLTSYSKSPNAVQAIDSTKTIVLRDFASNVKRMLEIIEMVDRDEVLEEEWEIISIKYALSADIEAVLNTMTTTGAPARATSGSSTSRPSTSRPSTSRPSTSRPSPSRPSSSRTQRYQSVPRPGGSTMGGGTSGGLQNRINRLRQGSAVSGTGLPILGDTRIVAYERNNEVVLFGKKKNIAQAKEIIAKLDRVAKQVLIEAIIIDVALGDSKSFGASIRQSKQEFGGNSPNGGLSSALASALGPAAFTPTAVQDATTGFSYWGFLGSSWEMAVNALETDTRVDMLSTPRIQTSHAKEASLFIGEERPMITGTFSDISGGQNAQVQRQRIGITLDILPFINDEGLVVMDISQRIQDIIGNQTIDGNQVPITTDRSAESTVSVRDGEMVMLGGFIKTKKSVTKNGVPVLRHVPLLGRLFESESDTEERYELIVLLRPTVLDTPAAANAKALELRSGSPGIDGARHNEKFIEDKWRYLRDQEKKLLDKKSLKYRLPGHQSKPDLNQFPLQPRLPQQP